MGRMFSLLGKNTVVELVSADPAGTLQTYVDKGFDIVEPILSENLVLRFSVPQTQERALRELAKTRGEDCKILRRSGKPVVLRSLKRRVLFLLFVLMIVVFSMVASKRVWFICVDGNRNLKSEEILAAGEKCGLHFWVNFNAIDKNQFKNQLIKELPGIQWVGLNHTGGIVKIIVSEKTQIEKIDDFSGVADVVAVRDGLILSFDAFRGQAVCQVGQAVRAGEILITGCIEHPYQMQYTCAKGEVYALTQREIRAVLPAGLYDKSKVRKEKMVVSLILGKNKIKIFGNSGISSMSCDKMRTVKSMPLPGKYRLPFSLVIERVQPFEITETTTVPDIESAVAQYTDRYIQADMIAGEILNRKIQLIENDETTEVVIFYTCREMIARQKKVIWFEGEDTNDGTYRERGESGGSY